MYFVGDDGVGIVGHQGVAGEEFDVQSQPVAAVAAQPEPQVPYRYWADVLGLLVWEEMPSAYRFTQTSIERLTAEWTEIIARDLNSWRPRNR